MKQINLQKILNKLRNKFIKLGVKMIAPETIFFSKDTKIGKNVVIDPYVVIGSKVNIGNNVKIFSFSHLESSKIENDVNRLNHTCFACIYMFEGKRAKKWELKGCEQRNLFITPLLKIKKYISKSKMNKFIYLKFCSN